MTTDGILSESFIDAFRVFEEKKQKLSELLRERESEYPPAIIMQFLKKARGNGTFTHPMIRSLTGISTPKSMKMRREMINERAPSEIVAESLGGSRHA